MLSFSFWVRDIYELGGLRFDSFTLFLTYFRFIVIITIALCFGIQAYITSSCAIWVHSLKFLFVFLVVKLLGVGFGFLSFFPPLIFVKTGFPACRFCGFGFFYKKSLKYSILV
ncbi:hypothetical protein DFP73DRAFT_203337 [Morchella snyderi]|nr:hypothetical protein DFP73DRAFT_203337 [Morchella snyderi]